MEPPLDVSEPRPARARVLSAAMLMIVLAGLLGSIYAIGFYAGPYRWFAELQLRHLGSYGVTVTVALTVLLFLVPPIVAIRVLAMNGTLPAEALAVALFTPGRRSLLAARLGRARRWLIVAGVGLVLGGLSIRDLVVAARGQELQKLTAAALEQSTLPTSTWLEVEGLAVWDASLETKEDRDEWTYVPAVSADWQEGQKVRALLRIATRDVAAFQGDVPLQGTVDLTGVPGMVRSAYEDAGLDVSEAVLLDLGDSPRERARASTFILGVGGFLFLLGGAGAFFRLRR